MIFIKDKINSEGMWTTLVVMTVCMILGIVFPFEDLFQVLAVNAVFFVFLPVLYIKIILKRNLRDFGVRFGNVPRGFGWMLSSLLVVGLLVYGIVNFFDIRDDFREVDIIRRRFDLFVTYYVGIGVTMMMTEFFFRGFVLNYFKEIVSVKYFVIFIQLVFASVFIVVLEGFHFGWDVLIQSIAAFFAGVIAYNSKSIIYSYLFSLVLTIITATMIMKMNY